MGKTKAKWIQLDGNFFDTGSSTYVALKSGSALPISSSYSNTLGGFSSSDFVKTSDSSSLSVGTASLAHTASFIEFNDINGTPTLLSGSAQIASDISGSFNAPSGSFSTRVTDLESFSSSLDATFATDTELTSLSASLTVTDNDLQSQIITNSSSLASRVTSTESDISNLQTDSGSFSTRVTDLESFSSSLDNIYISSSGQNATLGIISGSKLKSSTHLVPPTFTTTQRDALTNVESGSLIFNLDTLTYNTYKGTGWVNLISLGGGGNLSYSYTADTTITPPPNTRRIQWNNATQASATQLYVHDVTSTGINIETTLLNTVNVGSTITIRASANSNQYQIWKVTSITNQTNYVQYGVTLLESVGGNFTNNQALLFVFDSGTALTSTRVGYGNSSNLLSGSGEFTYNTTTDTLSVPNITATGNSTFGDTSDDTHQFTGSVSVLGSGSFSQLLSADGDIEISSRVYHKDDSNTYLHFNNDEAYFSVGGQRSIFTNTSKVIIDPDSNGIILDVNSGMQVTGSVNVDGGIINDNLNTTLQTLTDSNGLTSFNWSSRLFTNSAGTPVGFLNTGTFISGSFALNFAKGHLTGSWNTQQLTVNDELTVNSGAVITGSTLINGPIISDTVSSRGQFSANTEHQNVNFDIKGLNWLPYINLSVTSSNFTIGETISGSVSNATATVLTSSLNNSSPGYGTVRIVSQSGNFISSDVITGLTSNLSASIDAPNFNSTVNNNYSALSYDSDDNSLMLIGDTPRDKRAFAKIVGTVQLTNAFNLANASRGFRFQVGSNATYNELEFTNRPFLFTGWSGNGFTGQQTFFFSGVPSATGGASARTLMVHSNYFEIRDNAFARNDVLFRTSIVDNTVTFNDSGTDIDTIWKKNGGAEAGRYNAGTDKWSFASDTDITGSVCVSNGNLSTSNILAVGSGSCYSGANGVYKVSRNSSNGYTVSSDFWGSTVYEFDASTGYVTIDPSDAGVKFRYGASGNRAFDVYNYQKQRFGDDLAWEHDITGSVYATGSVSIAGIFNPPYGTSRPTGIQTGSMFFDTSLGVPIWYNGSDWINATGAIV